MGVLVIFINRFRDLVIIVTFLIRFEFNSFSLILIFNDLDLVFFFFRLILKSSQFPLNL